MQPWKISNMQVDCDTPQIHYGYLIRREKKLLAINTKSHISYMVTGKKGKWRHLDTMQFKTIIRCNILRIECLIYGIKSTSVSWADVRSHYMFAKNIDHILFYLKHRITDAVSKGINSEIQ